ncbi:hypothetical protein BcepSauron_441 [Burkholderia phage BcepSauron]|uniref:Uncharacterized protein n=1 Tax=Burkholderia phage BcepSauron TaxID=2530033 RepID=A0A482ML86_9CAUD|nr:hypothetical protein H1O17_gp441 [Burkholderia phage BcepSauron]QBQ74821.1 hypothetical protein BcepSauron_441 [Burkholderia phage BcepSauron]
MIYFSNIYCAECETRIGSADGPVGYILCVSCNQEREDEIELMGEDEEDD